ncbi:MAG: hypothetical protein ACI4J7_01315 [Ruminiclostridium sp.]
MGSKLRRRFSGGASLRARSACARHSGEISEIGGKNYLLLFRKSKLGGTAGVGEASRAAASAAARVCAHAKACARLTRKSPEIGGKSNLLLSRKAKTYGIAGVVEAIRAAASAAAQICAHAPRARLTPTKTKSRTESGTALFLSLSLYEILKRK